jgi:uroporphyrinogen decarboxylase
VSFFEAMGYDTVSFERLITAILPGSGALYSHKPPAITNRADFDRYPWDGLPELFVSAYYREYELLREYIPEGMKAVGGPGNGVFECVQDLVGYENLCYIAVDDPKLYADLFRTVGDVILAIWSRFVKDFGDVFAVLRFGDDLGFKSSTLLAPEDIRRHIIPQYRRIIALVHGSGKPFLLHSCGNIFSVMDDLIEAAGIDAKHSNEDLIAPFSLWVQRYGQRIGNFGGVDTDVLCQMSERDIRAYVGQVIGHTSGHGGIAIGSGNSIADYVPVSGYLAMVEAVRGIRGE